ncbi:MAG TPA: type VII secretion-associated serine protease mycosin [Micromonospora sp.]|nr:type VII secretion-associated serine protease mycosin [Micromonospora sp.]
MSALPRQYRGAGAWIVAITFAATAWSTPTPAGAATGGPAGAAAGAAVSARLPGSPLGIGTIRADQWQLRELNAPAAWKFSTGRGVTVAVIDSGVDSSHPDLAGQVLPGADLVQQSGDGRIDPVGHGTTVAGLIAGGDEQRGVTGLAPEAKILPVRVLDEENRYDDALIVAKAVHWAVDNGAQVINLSLGGAAESPPLAAAIDYAFDHDVVVVACTGNQTSTTGRQQVWYPAREPGVIAVTGLDGESDALWSGALTGEATVLAAPATRLVGARPGGYWRVQGTSFATPLVTATAALIRARWPHMSAGEVVNRLITTARDLGPAGRDATFGFGRVDPVAALTSSVPGVERNPLDDDSPTAVVGLGPAPGFATESAPPAPRPHRNQFGGRIAEVSSGWATRAVADQEERSLLTLWGGGALLLIAVAGGVPLARSVARSARRHRGHRGSVSGSRRGDSQRSEEHSALG